MPKQPVGPIKINWRHPMSSGLVGFYMTKEPGFVSDLAYGQHGRPLTGSNFTPVISENGQAVSIEANNSMYVLPEGPVSMRGETAFTAAAIAKYDALGSWTNFPQLINKSNGGGGTNGYTIFNRSTDNSLRFQINGNSNSLSTPVSITTNEWFTAIFSSEKLGPTANNKSSLNGVLGTPPVNTLTNTSFPDVATGHSIGATGGSQTASWRGDIELIAIWNRGFTDAEHASFAADPYQITEPLYDYLAPTGKAAVVVALVANDLISLSSVGTPTLGQTHGITANDLSALSSVGSPLIGQTHGLSPESLEALSSIGSPVLGQAHGLTADDLAALSSVGSPLLGQAHGLTASDLVALSSVGSPAIASAIATRVVAMRSGASSATITDGSNSATLNDGSTTATINNGITEA